MGMVEKVGLGSDGLARRVWIRTKGGANRNQLLERSVRDTVLFVPNLPNNVSGESINVPGESNDGSGEQNDVSGEHNDVSGESNDVSGESNGVPGESNNVLGEFQ